MVTTLTIDGMRSTHCARAVYTALAMVPGIAVAEVVPGRATLEHDAPLDAGALEHAVALAGYTLRATITRRRHLTLHPDPSTAPSPSETAAPTIPESS